MKQRLGLMILATFLSTSAIAGPMTREEFIVQRNTLVHELGKVENAWAAIPYSADPNSEYQQAANKITQILNQLRALAVQRVAD